MSSAIQQGHALSSASRDAGAFRSTLREYLPPRVYTRELRTFEQDLSVARAEDLYANDGLARSGVNSIATNVVGTGLVPQSVIPAELLGIAPEQAKAVQDQMEWLWTEWCSQAHYRNQMTFEDLQLVGLRSLIRTGEMIHLPVMEQRPGCRFALKIQDIRPARLRTPSDKLYEPLIHEGVEVSVNGVPQAYWIASPPPVSFVSPYELRDLPSSSFRRIPARVGHRPGLFHIFRAETEEQFRGVSCLAPAVAFFRSLHDSIDYELLAQILAASFPIFISKQSSQLPSVVQAMELRNMGGFGSNTGVAAADSSSEEKFYYQELSPGQIMYGNENEKPEVLESNRPSSNFMNFCDLVMRITASSLEIPYEVLTKDFSKTTYSSARAALLEAWRVYAIYRSFFTRQYCQPLWCMVMEEAWLRGYLQLPAGAPDFYEAQALWCNTRWIGPARGYIDPTKEIQANIEAINAGLMSRSEAIAERGGDFDDVTDQLAAEKKRYEELGITLTCAPSGTQAPGSSTSDTTGTEDSNDTQDTDSTERGNPESGRG